MDPRTDWEAPLFGAIHETISAMSALNCEPSPIPDEERMEGAIYLSETDAIARHAYEHLHAAVQLMSKAQKQLEDVLRGAVYVLDVYHDRCSDQISETPEWVAQQFQELIQEYRKNREANK